MFLSINIILPHKKYLKINDKKFSKYINIIALSYGLLILITYF